MPFTKQESKLLAGVQGRVAKAYDAAKMAKPTVGGRLPAGINNGVALLSDLEVRNNNGKPRIRIRGKVVTPEEFEGMATMGMNVNIDHDIADLKSSKGETWRTIEQATELLLIDIKKLLPVDEQDQVENTTELGEAIDIVREMLKDDNDHHFLFHTWEAKSGYVNADLDGLFLGELPDEVEYEEEDEEEGEEYEEEDVPEDTGYAVGDSVTVEDSDGIWNGTITEDYDNGETYAVESEDGEVWDISIDQFVVGEEEGEEEEEEEVEEEEEPEEEEEEEEEEEVEVLEPEKGDICLFKVGRAKLSDHEVLTVSKAQETTSLRNLKTKKVIKGVGWDKLVWPEE